MAIPGIDPRELTQLQGTLRKQNKAKSGTTKIKLDGVGGTKKANDRAGELVSAVPDQVIDAATMDQYAGRIRGTNDAAAGQSLASLSQRMGTTSSPLFNLLAGGTRGAAAANSAGQLLNMKLQAAQQNAQQAATKAGLGLDLAGLRQQGSLSLAQLAEQGRQFDASNTLAKQSLTGNQDAQAFAQRMQQLQMGLTLNPYDGSGMAAATANELGTAFPSTRRNTRISWM